MSVSLCGISLVDLDGFEPSTSSMPWKRAPNCATGPHEVGRFYLTTPSKGLLAVAYSFFGIRPAR